MEELLGRWARTLTFKDFTIAAYACTCMEGDFEDPDQWRLWLMLSCSLRLHLCTVPDWWDVQEFQGLEDTDQSSSDLIPVVSTIYLLFDLALSWVGCRKGL